MCVAYKEARETAYWLELLEDSDITNIDISLQKNQCKEILRILTKIKVTTESSLSKLPPLFIFHSSFFIKTYA